MELVNIKVGTILKHAIGKPDGPQINISDSGIDILVHIKKPSAKEKMQFEAQKSPFQMKLALEKNIIFFLLKFGDMPWMDAPYSVHLSDGLTTLPEIEEGKGLAARVYLIDTDTGKIEAIRLLGLTTSISRLLVKLVKNQQNTEFDMDEYVAAIQDVYAKKSTNQLVKEGLGSCKLS